MVIISYEKYIDGFLMEIGTVKASSLLSFLSLHAKDTLIKSVTEVSKDNPGYYDILHDEGFVYKYTEWVYFVKASGYAVDGSSEVPIEYHTPVSLSYPLVHKEDMNDIVQIVKKFAKEDGFLLDNVSIDSVSFLHQK